MNKKFVNNYNKDLNDLLNDINIKDLNNLDCLIIDNYNNNIDEKLFYSILKKNTILFNFILLFNFIIPFH